MHNTYCIRYANLYCTLCNYVLYTLNRHFKYSLFYHQSIIIYHLTFCYILQPRDEKCRAELRNCASKNVAVSGRQNSVVISQDLLQETIILSDLFEVNEYVALDLLCVGECCSHENRGTRKWEFEKGGVKVHLFYLQ